MGSRLPTFRATSPKSLQGDKVITPAKRRTIIAFTPKHNSSHLCASLPLNVPPPATTPSRSTLLPAAGWRHGSWSPQWTFARSISANRRRSRTGDFFKISGEYQCCLPPPASGEGLTHWGPYFHRVVRRIRWCCEQLLITGPVEWWVKVSCASASWIRPSNGWWLSAAAA